MKRIFLCVIVIVATAGSASALDPGFYVGAGFGFSSFDLDDFNAEYGDLYFKDENFGFKVFGGYQIIKYLAAEVSYTDYGNLSTWETAVTQAHQHFDVGITSWDASAVGTIPLGRKSAIFAKVGVASWNANAMLTLDGVAEDQSQSGTDVTFGVGADIVLKKFGVRFEGDWLDIPDTSGAFMISISLTYHF